MENNDISDADKALFRESIGPVEKISHDQAIIRKPARHSRSPFSPVAEESTAVNAEAKAGGRQFIAGDQISFKRPGIQHKFMSKLKRGQFAIQGELDLHGLTADRAGKALDLFLNDCSKRNYRYALIIHGKGKGSQGGQPVIKNRLHNWLVNKQQVLAFCSARPVDGGTGAVYVLLRNGQ